MMLDIILRKLPNHHGEISVMSNNFYFKLFHTIFSCSLSFLTWIFAVKKIVVFCCFYIFFCITIKRPCNILQYFTDVKTAIFRRKIELSYFCSIRRLWVHVRTVSEKSTQNLCFTAKLEKYFYSCKSQFYYIKVGENGVYITWTCYHDGFFYDRTNAYIYDMDQPVFLRSPLSSS